MGDCAQKVTSVNHIRKLFMQWTASILDIFFCVQCMKYFAVFTTTFNASGMTYFYSLRDSSSIKVNYYTSCVSVPITCNILPSHTYNAIQFNKYSWRRLL